MKFEDIEVGKTYKRENYNYLVKYKDEESRMIVVYSAYFKSIFIVEQGFYKELEPLSVELPEKGLVVHEEVGSIIYRTGEDSGYGFNKDGTYDISNDWNFGMFPECWRPATKEEKEQFIKLLEKEALKRGFTADTKLNKQANGAPCCGVDFRPVVTLQHIWNKNGLVFDLGTWAEPLEDALSEQIEALKSKAKDLGLKVNVTIE